MNIGEKYNRLTVMGFKGKRDGIVIAKCDCGNEVELMRCHIIKGINKSCGCLLSDSPKQRFTKHGHVKQVNNKRVASPEYRAWQNMRNRCLNPKAQDFKYYGGIGIGVDSSWNTFDQFFSDMGARPSADYTLDRIDTAKNYGPTNCRWATRLVQARNRPYAKTRTWELAKQLGVKTTTAAHYIWKVRAKDKNKISYFDMSPELEQKVRSFIEKGKIKCV